MHTLSCVNGKSRCNSGNDIGDAKDTGADAVLDDIPGPRLDRRDSPARRDSIPLIREGSTPEKSTMSCMFNSVMIGTD